MKTVIYFLSILLLCSCSEKSIKGKDLTAVDILGNPEYLAFSYGGYRQNNRDIVPTVDELKDDMKILSTMGVKLLRTYNTKQYGHAANLLEAIKELRDEDPNFEMYVMLGTWIECEGAWTSAANHNAGNVENNTAEIETAVAMANAYPDIVKIIAVGNEAMVQWAVNYFVYPNVILDWVKYLRELQKNGKLSSDIWITSSDNYESWGGGAKNYQTDDLAALIKSVDFVSLHTYPFHDSHYNPHFWGVPEEEEDLSDVAKADAAMVRAKNYAIAQYQNAADYISSLGIQKPIHIGETGWATIAASSYGKTGSQAADEYKEKLYYEHMREWTKKAGMSCFYFEAFDEQWKDQGDALGSENHFGLIKLNGQAKYALWEMVDNGTFKGLTRNGIPITKTYDGDKTALMANMLTPPLMSEMGILEISTLNAFRNAGEMVTESKYVVIHEKHDSDATYPSAKLKLNPWEGTCSIEMTQEGVIEVVTGTGAWWGSALEIQGGIGEDLSNFANGYLHFEIKGDTGSSFNIGFQTGSFANGNQVNNYVTFGSSEPYSITEEWSTHSIAISDMNQGANLKNVTGILFFRGINDFDGKHVYMKNVYYSRE